MKFKLKKIKSDASFREFYRLYKGKRSSIIVTASKEKQKNIVLYSAINKFYRKKGIYAPKSIKKHSHDSILEIEDLGKDTLLQHVKNSKNKLSLYKKCVDLILKIQKIKPPKKIKISVNKYKKFDTYDLKNLNKESDLFFDWYLPIFFSKKKVLKIKKKSKKVLSKIYNKLNFPNTYFVHRDYHLQNLMKVGNKIGLIDTQDALIGNPAYDLVSLIDDVRIKTSKKLKDEIYYYYLKKNSKINKTDYEKFLHDFKILSVQRSMKIIGIFSRLSKRDKKNKYLKFIPYTWRLLEMRMDSEIFSELKDIFNKSINQKIRRKKIIK